MANENMNIIGAGQDTARPAPKKILDVCCGPRGMWFDKFDERALFLDKRDEEHRNNYPSGYKCTCIHPDEIGNFTSINYPDNSFWLVVFDPPHISRNIENPSVSGETFKRYGILPFDWKTELTKGFAECFRVLKPNGTLIFKWNEVSISIHDVLALTPEKPLFGHVTRRNLKTHWVAFMKEERTSCAQDSPAQNTVEICHTAPNSARHESRAENNMQS